MELQFIIRSILSFYHDSKINYKFRTIDTHNISDIRFYCNVNINLLALNLHI